MKSFRFPLERVLHWRKMRQRAEEEKLARLENHLSMLLHREKQIQALQIKSETEVLNRPTVSGADLKALSAFRLRLEQEKIKIREQQVRCAEQIKLQRLNLLKARQEYRVLEKLKEKRHEIWTYEHERELENLASEAFLARWQPDQY